MIDLLAKEYHDRTEHYDRTVCTGPIVEGCIRPNNGKEHTLINQNAKTIFNELAKRENITLKDLHHRIIGIENNYHYDENDLIGVE